MTTFRQVWFFAKPYKIKIFLMILFLIIVQALAVLNPLIIGSIIDDYIVGIQKPWNIVEVNDDEYTVTINQKNYKQERYLNCANATNCDKTEPMDTVISDASLLVFDQDFYLVDQSVEQPKEFSQLNQEAAFKLSTEEVKLMYNTIVDPLFMTIILLFGVLFLTLVFSYLQRLMGALLTIVMTREMRVKAMSNLNYVNLEVIEKQPAGKLANRIISDSMGVVQFLTTFINTFISSFIGIILGFIAMYTISPRLTMYCFILLPIIIFWTYIVTKKVRKVAEDINETNSLMVAKINEVINGIGILKIFNKSKKTLDDFNDINEKFVEESVLEVKIHTLFGWNGVNLFQALIGGIIIIYFSYSQLVGTSSVNSGDVYAYYTLVFRLIAPITVMFQQFGVLEHSKVKSNRFYNFLDNELEDKTISKVEFENYDISFQNVDFGYSSDQKVLKNINLEIKENQKIGLVGHTGSGKSTLMNLLMRFNDLKDSDNGLISIGDLDINSVTKRSYRNHIGIILQEPVLFNASLRQNLLFGSELSDEKLLELFKLLGGDLILSKFDDGLDQKISARGTNLSLGEKQLISFTRILVKNPKIIIMDEATANIDVQTEMMIQHALSIVGKNRTLIIIAHRLSTIVDSDEIVVLSNGEILEQDNHKNLLKLDGYYANMYRSQVS